MKKLSIIILICCFISSCKKKDLSELNYCDPLPTTPDFGWFYVNPDTGISRLHYNPLDPNEIIYLEHHYLTGEFWLCKLNLNTKEKDYVYEADFTSNPYYGNNNWIIFCLSDKNVYKIRPDGTGLTKLTHENKSFAAMWSFDCSEIYFQTHLVYDKPNGFGKIRQGIGVAIDINGNITDTLWGGWGGNLSVLNDSIAAYIGDRGLDIYNFREGTFKPVFSESKKNTNSTGIVWLNEKEVCWSRLDGVYKTNIESGKTIQLRYSCNSNYYKRPAYSKTDNKIIFEHVTSYADGDRLYGKTSFVSMNKDGSNETEIEIIY